MALSNKDVAVTAETWDRRLGHRNFDGPAKLAIQQAVVGLNIRESFFNEIRGPRDWQNVGVCGTCTIGRQHKESMTGTRQKTTNLLENIHSDVCGPITSAKKFLFGIMVFFMFRITWGHQE